MYRASYQRRWASEDAELEEHLRKPLLPEEAALPGQLDIASLRAIYLSFLCWGLGQIPHVCSVSSLQFKPLKM